MSLAGNAVKGLLQVYGRFAPDVDDDPGKALENAQAYNEKHPFRRGGGFTARYGYHKIAGYPCIRMRSRRGPHRREKTILYLHGGIQNTWSEELMVAEGYARHTGMDVWYPVYPSISEVPVWESTEVIYEVYKRIVAKYGSALAVAVVGTSLGGTFGFRLIDRINKDEGGIGMPAVFIANSPGCVPDTKADWKEMELFSENDPLISIRAVQNIEAVQKLICKDTEEGIFSVDRLDFHRAPQTFVWFGEETLAGTHLAYARAYQRCGVEDRLHVQIQPGMMHGYSCMPVFKESREAYTRQIRILENI